MPEITTREFQDAEGFWIVGADVFLGDENHVRWVELWPTTPPATRELATKMCADALRRELHAATA